MNRDYMQNMCKYNKRDKLVDVIKDMHKCIKTYNSYNKRYDLNRDEIKRLDLEIVKINVQNRLDDTELNIVKSKKEILEEDNKMVYKNMVDNKKVFENLNKDFIELKEIEYKIPLGSSLLKAVDNLTSGSNRLRIKLMKMAQSLGTNDGALIAIDNSSAIDENNNKSYVIDPEKAKLQVPQNMMNIQSPVETETERSKNMSTTSAFDTMLGVDESVFDSNKFLNEFSSVLPSKDVNELMCNLSTFISNVGKVVNESLDNIVKSSDKAITLSNGKNINKINDVTKKSIQDITNIMTDVKKVLSNTSNSILNTLKMLSDTTINETIKVSKKASESGTRSLVTLDKIADDTINSIAIAEKTMIKELTNILNVELSKYMASIENRVNIIINRAKLDIENKDKQSNTDSISQYKSYIILSVIVLIFFILFIMTMSVVGLNPQ